MSFFDTNQTKQTETEKTLLNMLSMVQDKVLNGFLREELLIKEALNELIAQQFEKQDENVTLSGEVVDLICDVMSFTLGEIALVRTISAINLLEKLKQSMEITIAIQAGETEPIPLMPPEGAQGE